MRKLLFSVLGIGLFLSITGCHDHETYADQKEKERKAINKYIADSAVNVISEATFLAQDSTTNVARNEFVLFENTGVYMQIIRKGCGERIKKGESCDVLCRFTEYNIMGDSIQLSNNVLYYASIVDKMTVKNTSGTFTGIFDPNSSLLYSTYSQSGDPSVPPGWLVPLSYINVGRPVNVGDETAKVKIIVPHSQGHNYAVQSVYPCLYEITYERGR